MCSQHYHQERSIVRYIHIVDKLLKTSVFNQMIQSYLVELYCETFKFLLEQRAFNELDEMKLLRKMWLKSIHPRLLIEIKEIVQMNFNIDLDKGFKPRDISLIKSHYI